MVLYDLKHEIQSNPKITVRPATNADVNDMVYLYEHGYPVPHEIAQVSLDMILALNGKYYLAFLEEVERPISIATMFAYPGHPILVLQGAATLEAYRGNGAYSALVAQRLTDGRAQGMEVAILQADRRTSAPICANLGFKEICSWDLWAWGIEDDAH
jgi:predicted GNAT family acetyltransferase